MAGWAPVFDRLAGVAARAVRGVCGGSAGSGRAGVRPAPDTCSGARSGSCVGSGGRRDSQVAEHVLEAVVAEHRALEAGRANVDAEQVEQVVRADGGHVLDRLALDLVGQQAGALVRRVGVLDDPEVVGPPVVLEDVIAIEVVHVDLDYSANVQSRPYRSDIDSA